MAIHVYTKKPTTLLRKIREGIAAGSIETWEINSDGDFTHTSDQWKKKGYFTPDRRKGFLSFGLVGEKNKEMLKEVYGVYHGRFIQMLLNHFDDYFDSVTATAEMDDIDEFN